MPLTSGARTGSLTKHVQITGTNYYINKDGEENAEKKVIGISGTYDPLTAPFWRALNYSPGPYRVPYWAASMATRVRCMNVYRRRNIVRVE